MTTTLRETEADEKHLNTIKAKLNIKTKTEAIRMAIKVLANLVRE